ncbi:transmembrane protein, putative (macronuclear) [Tetrahymena thermophila SB210]|uniref:Transmembrane protein, putative n=1 Tax=Tetrahymena thermophila (strain SB210) TaxID=312017 RepID=W7XE23_TETTS|nr:transmembrane protein, putative [Tetrahymena thermophila SB210]EWS71104.1 transmembrane protein, putative [Tetrahymena thermophila SB210]|eukprot:XP_012656347.1 transmembrane protein, putative [Tetrahymena thermophila SB210]
MQYPLSLKFVSTISIPIIVGFVGMIVLQYFYFIDTFESWKVFTNQWIEQMEKQRLHNFVYPNKVIAESQLNNIAFIMRLSKSIKLKVDQDIIIIHPKYSPVFCSMRSYHQQLCQNAAYTLFQKNPLFLDQWFHRNIQDYNNLSAQQQDTLHKSVVENFIFKIIYKIYGNDLFETTFQSKTYSDSLMSTAPSRASNYENAAYETCMPGQFLEAFDPRCRDWYLEALKNDHININVPLLLQSSQFIGVVASAFIKATNSNSQSCVQGLNISIENFREKILARQDNDDVTSDYEGYSVMFHKINATIFNHRYWNRNSQQLKSWDQIEYNQTSTYFLYERDYFINNLTDIIQYSQNGNYSIYQKQNIDPFYISFSRDNKKYFGLVYPLKIAQTLTMQRVSTSFALSNLFLGRVHKDIRDLIEEANFNFNKYYKTLSIVETVITSIIVITFLIRYFVFLYNSHDVPLNQLIVFLRRKDLNVQISQPQIFQNPKQEINASIVNNSIPQQAPISNNIINFNGMQKLNQTDLNLINNQIGTAFLSKNIGSIAFDTSEQVSSNVYLKTEKEQKILKISKNVLQHSRLILNKQYIVDKGNYCRSINIKNHKTKNLTQVKFLVLWFFILIDRQQFPLSTIQQQSIKSKRILQEISTKSNILKNAASISQNNIQSFKISQNNHQNAAQSSNASILESTQLNKSTVMELDDIQGIFKEMQVIIDTFKGLENVIKLAQFNQKMGNYQSSIIHYSVLNQRVKNINNLNATGSCYMNLGLLQLKESQFEDAASFFQSSVQYTLYEMNINSLSEFVNKINQGELIQLNNGVKLMYKLSKRLRLQAVALIYSYERKQDYKNSSILQQALNLLNISISIQNLAYNSYSELQIQICRTLIAEIYFLQEKNQQAQIMVELLLNEINLNKCQVQDTNMSFHFSFKKIPMFFSENHNGSFENSEKNTQRKLIRNKIKHSTLSLSRKLQFLQIKLSIQDREQSQLQSIKILIEYLEQNKYLESSIQKQVLLLIQNLISELQTKHLKIKLNQIQTQLKEEQKYQFNLNNQDSLEQQFYLEMNKELQKYNENSYDLLFLVNTNNLFSIDNIQRQLSIIQQVGEQFLKNDKDTFSIYTYGQYTQIICHRIPFSMNILLYCIDFIYKEIQKETFPNNMNSQCENNENQDGDQQKPLWAETICNFLNRNQDENLIYAKQIFQSKQKRIAINFGVHMSNNCNEFFQNFLILIENKQILQNISQILNLNLIDLQNNKNCTNENYHQNDCTKQSKDQQDLNNIATYQAKFQLQQSERYIEMYSIENLLRTLTSQRQSADNVNEIYLI